MITPELELEHPSYDCNKIATMDKMNFSTKLKVQCLSICLSLEKIIVEKKLKRVALQQHVVANWIYL